jgi:hypothetical protein
VFGNKTVAFALGLVTFFAMLVFISGIVRVVAEGHPDSAPATALDTLLD